MRRGRRGLTERGSTLVLATVSMLVLMGMAAIAMDIGMLLKVRAEAQRAADASALAGASAFLLDPNFWPVPIPTEAQSRAYQLADTNYMAGAKIDTTSEVTVWIIPESVKVRVRVRRAAVPTWFAKVFGLSSFPVGAIAAAEASYASGTACVKPIAMADIWDERGDCAAQGNNDCDANGNRWPDGNEQWLYSNVGSPASPWDSWTATPGPDQYAVAHYSGVQGSGIGYGSEWRSADRDWGMQVILRPPVNVKANGDTVDASFTSDTASTACPSGGTGNASKCYVPGWWGLWGGTTGEMANMITSCDSTTRSVGETVPTSSGWRGPVNQAVEAVYALDPNIVWNDGVTDPQTGYTGTVTYKNTNTPVPNWRQSPRTWIMAVIDPGHAPSSPGSGNITFNNFMLFFFEGCRAINKNNGQWTGQLSGNCKNPHTAVVGRFAGIAQGTKAGPVAGTMVRMLRLVE